MDPFEYLSVLTSIILGLALTQLMTGAGRLIRHRARVKFPPVAVWMGILFIVIVQSWWTMFTLRRHQLDSDPTPRVDYTRFHGPDAIRGAA